MTTSHVGPEPQLGFPWREEVLQTCVVTELHRRVCLRIEMRAGPGETELRLSVVPRHAPGDFWYSKEQFKIRIRTAHPARCLVNGRLSTCDLMPLNEHEGPFADAIEWVRDLDPAYESEPDDRWTDLEARVALREVAVVVAQRVVDSCDPVARGLALQFADDARMFVYAAALGDATGRIAQMSECCPGLLVLAAVGRRPEIVEGIRNGVSLALLLRAALSEVTHRPGAMTLVRRAPRALPVGHLLSVIAAAGADENDVPFDPKERWIWYRQIATWGVLKRQIRDLGARQQLGSFVSKHAIALETISDEEGMDLESLLSSIVDWIELGDGRTPSRRSAPRTVIAAVGQWHASLWTSRNLDPETPLAAGPQPVAETDGIVATQIVSVGELLREGREMSHCVGAHASYACDGKVFIYRAVVSTQRVTIAVAPSGDTWRLVEARGFANQFVKKPFVIDRWLRTLAWPS